MDALEVLKHLQARRNVLLTGAPATGKSRLMNAVARAFEAGTALPAPAHVPGAAIPVPAPEAAEAFDALPMLRRANRRVFRTTLHQNSKYRDFLTGIAPRIDGTEGYRISEGILYRANEFARQPDSAALLIIDELNRGPAIEVFGGSIATIEADKRLADDNTPGPDTQFFELLDPAGGYVEYAFSPHLYLLAAMNQADVSVAPLDVAFLRRWKSLPLLPDCAPVCARFGIDPGAPVPDAPTSARDVYLAAVRALEAVNRKIAVGRGPEYQLGQGVFLSASPRGDALNDALDFALDCWAAIYAHVEELFFGEPAAMGYVLNADRGGSPYSLREVAFAGEAKFTLTHGPIDRGTVYGLYRSLSEADD